MNCWSWVSLLPPVEPLLGDHRAGFWWLATPPEERFLGCVRPPYPEVEFGALPKTRKSSNPLSRGNLCHSRLFPEFPLGLLAGWGKAGIILCSKVVSDGGRVRLLGRKSLDASRKSAKSGVQHCCAPFFLGVSAHQPWRNESCLKKKKSYE